MVILHGNCHTDITYVAVEEVVIETASSPADSAGIAVIYRFGFVIIPEFAFVTVVLRSLDPTVTAKLCC